MPLLSPPLTTLFETPGLPTANLPADLLEAYGGDLGFERSRVIANFVTSLDGVVSLPEGGESGKVISGASVADRFVMGLLRAVAGAVIVGAGTFRRSPRHVWRAERIFPEAGASFAELRRRLGLPPAPRFVLVSASGDVDVTQPAIDGALVATTAKGAERISAKLPASASLFVASGDQVRLGELLSRLLADGAGVVLSEAGPTVFAELVRGRLVDELFVTTSPALFGRFPGDQRRSLVDGASVAGTRLELLTTKRAGSYLFSRYALLK